MKILFVCLGNICRSPTAEGVFEKLLSENQLENSVAIDSAGTSGFHEGEKADSRMRAHCSRRSYDLKSLSRAVRRDDFTHFDLIIGMDEKNIRDLEQMAESESERSKIKLMTDYCQNLKVRGVPDPYYGGPEGFERVIDIVEDACQGLLEQVIHGAK